ncbi:MAG: GGDEF domain-containing protein [Sphingopyxis sp.]
MITTAAFFWVVPALFALFAAAFAVVGWHPAGTRSARWAAAGFAIACVGSIVDTQREFLPAGLGAMSLPSHWATMYCLLNAILVRHDLRLPRAALLVWTVLFVPALVYLLIAPLDYVWRILLMNVSVPLLIMLALPGLWRVKRQAIDNTLFGLLSAAVITYPIRIALFFSLEQGREIGSVYGWSQYLVIFYLVIAVLGILTALAIMLACGMDIVAKHHAESCIDSLTEVGNRRAFDRWLERDAAGASHYGAILMVDLDRFKNVNDRHGHAAGDEVLKAVAAELRAKLDSVGDVARIGGEEFVVLIHAENAFAAAMLAMTVREAIAAIRWPGPLGALRLTASVGVAMRAQGGDLREVLRRADMAVYQAKAGGRNAAVTADMHDGLCVMRQVA